MIFRSCHADPAREGFIEVRGTAELQWPVTKLLREIVTAR